MTDPISLRPYFCESCKTIQPQRRRVCFTAVLAFADDLVKLGIDKTHGGWLIGRCEEGSRGYAPVLSEGVFEREEKARVRAAVMNQHIGWKDEAEAQMMVLTTMPMKEDHQANLLFRAAELFRLTDLFRKKGNENFSLEEWAAQIEEWLEDAKDYAKEEA